MSKLVKGCKPAVLVTLPLLLFFLAACDHAAVEDAASQETPLTAEELALRDKLQQTALVLVDVAQDQQAVTAVRESVQLRRQDGFDENVPFARLLGRGSGASKNAAYTEAGRPFADAFRTALAEQEAAGKTAGASGTALDPSELEGFLVDHDVIIYWPYAEHFEGGSDIPPTLTFHPLDESVERGIGYRLQRDDAGNYVGYEEVIVDEPEFGIAIRRVQAAYAAPPASSSTKAASAGAYKQLALPTDLPRSPSHSGDDCARSG